MVNVYVKDVILMDYTHEEIEEMLCDLYSTMDDAFGIIQNLTYFGENDLGIGRLMELYNKVEATLDLSREKYSMVMVRCINE